MTEPGTSYTAEITTPSGLTFHASIYVPPDAEYGNMHELAEAVMRHAAAMLIEHERDNETAFFEDVTVQCGHRPEGALESIVCGLPAGHAGGHRSDLGAAWNSPGH